MYTYFFLFISLCKFCVYTICHILVSYNTIENTFCWAKKKSEYFQGFFSKTLLIFGGRRCRSPYSIFIRHSDIELEQTSVSCCFRIFEAKNQANLYQYISKSSCPKVCRSVLKNQFCILHH